MWCIRLTLHFQVIMQIWWEFLSHIEYSQDMTQTILYFNVWYILLIWYFQTFIFGALTTEPPDYLHILFDYNCGGLCRIDHTFKRTDNEELIHSVPKNPQTALFRFELKIVLHRKVIKVKGLNLPWYYWYIHSLRLFFERECN